MLSSLLPSDNKSSARNRTNNSKYVLEVPRGFSVHVFKTPSPPAYAQSGAAKTDYSSRTPSSTGRKQQDYPSPSRPDPSRKPSFGRANDYFGEQTEEYDRSLELTRTKSHKPYSIYPGAIPDSYIYERSIASVSDLPGSPSSSESSSDTESLDTPIEASSIRARCSVETLEATLYDTQNTQVAPLSTSPYGSSYIAGPPAGRQLVVPPTTTSPLRYPPADDDESTVVSEDEQVTRLVQSPPLGYPPVVPITTPLVIPPLPVRRNSDERSSRSQAPTLTRRDSTQPTSRTSSPPGGVAPGEVAIRMPPGLQHVTAPAPVSRSTSRRPSTTTPPVTPPAGTGRSPKSERPSLSRSRSTSPAEAPAKTVRWHEDLISPSLPPPGERRKGWFNRRGDQLWTNDGRYKSPESGQEYPPDLACYPETNCGWMNEDGVRIDMQHRLVPKPPLRSALKRSKNSSSSVEQVSIS
ncbi:hypothetical protein PsYK624_125040 [Phanerochaete sordida]|uniref:Uncharacterized protein n=1 Tax=Phanerochaete sordida TaxID=48140 RepID=A0A9P3LIF5_9APHY|nr:hypothetical protein PsYK624_125040 [Phanerochaete sordida]